MEKILLVQSHKKLSKIISNGVDRKAIRIETPSGEQHSLNELLKIDLDGIIIATNTSAHFQIAKKCLLANHNIFVEKPVTNSLKRLKKLKKIAKAKNRKLLFKSR